MERTTLRLATVAALLHGGNGPPWPTLAGPYVFDSRMDDIKDVVAGQKYPVIIIRTDDDRDVMRSYSFVGRRCALLIEMSVLTAVVDDNGVPRLNWPRVDNQLEAFLDLLEHQVIVALKGFNEHWAVWWRGRYGYGTLGKSSTPRFSPPRRGNVRLSVRTLEWILQIPEECIDPPLHEFARVDPWVLPRNFEDVVQYILAYGGGEFKTAVQQLYDDIKAYGMTRRERYYAFQRMAVTIPDYEIDALWKIPQEASLETTDTLAARSVVTETQINTGGLKNANR